MTEVIDAVVLLVRFVKLGRVRFLGHRDVARAWERALRRVGFPVAHSEGFTPRPRVSFGLALPTCYQSLGEYLEVRVAPGAVIAAGPGGSVRRAGPGGGVLTVEELPASFSEALPPGLDCVAVDLRAKGQQSLQEAVTSCSWEFELCGLDTGEATRRVAELLAAPTVMVERYRKGAKVTGDVRPFVHDLRVVGESDEGAVCHATLAAQPRIVRPAELSSWMVPHRDEGLVTRTHQWIERDGERCEPLAVAVAAPRAETRAGRRDVIDERHAVRSGRCPPGRDGRREQRGDLHHGAAPTAASGGPPRGAPSG
jgi:hypothetical protein